MLKLTWLGSILLTVVFCTASASLAQKVRYEYAGPLDELQTVPLRDVITSGPSDRVSRLEPVKKLRPYHSGVSSAVVGRVARASAFSPAKQTSGRMTGRAIPVSPDPQVIREALPLDVPAPTFAGPLTDAADYPTQTHSAETRYVPESAQAPQADYSGALTDSGSYPTEPSYMPEQYDSPQVDYSGALTEFGNYPVETGYAPGPEDPTRFGYRDGKAFGFENNRLYNPLEGPQLDLQGAPTVGFGEPGCDEWDNFCRFRELDQETSCGGLKAKPGHLGMPWVGSKDNCDQRVPLLKNRGCGCKACEAKEEVCESCTACPTCGK